MISKPGRAQSRVFCIHGIVPRPDPARLAHRNFLARDRFREHLRNRKRRYVDLAVALRGGGDALTIDDATRAGYDAALAAREQGHAVTLFVNPGNVAARAPHFFALLCLVLDRSGRRSAAYLGRRFNLEGAAGRLELRQRVKRRLLGLAREDSRQACVRALARTLGVADLSTPRFFATLDIRALRSLRDKGVGIGNHGWHHASVGSLSPASAKRQVAEGRRWIEANLGAGVGAEFYAVPFGLDAPPFPLDGGICHCWLLNDARRPSGCLDERVFNRQSLKLP